MGCGVGLGYVWWLWVFFVLFVDGFFGVWVLLGEGIVSEVVVMHL
jgi:hypothetical protein